MKWSLFFRFSIRAHVKKLQLKIAKDHESQNFHRLLTDTSVSMDLEDGHNFDAES